MEDSKALSKEKVISLFKFVEKMNEARQKKVVNIKEYPWYCDISNIPDDPKNVTMCFHDKADEEESGNADKDDTLLVVHKPEFQECPKPDDSIVKWLSIGWDDFRKEVNAVNSAKDDAAEEGRKSETGEEWSQQSMLADDSIQLKMDEEAVIETISDAAKQENQETNNKEETFEDDPERVQKYQQWLAEREKWVERQKKIEEVRDFFVRLYQVYYQLKRDNETLELIAANGMLCSKENKAICHPVLTRRVKIEFDADTNTISVMDTDAPTELYTVLFQELKNINGGTVNELSGILQEKDIHPMDRNETPDYLNVLVHQLSPKSLFSRDGEPEDWQKNNDLLVYDAPCFILRNRLDGTVKAIEQIIQNIQETEEIPNPITDIVSGGKIDLPDEKPDNSIEAQLAAVGGESVDVLLSKEANREQLEIAKRIERFNAVLVQGPPGTGKTHTIANLMGHFLAQGKSVLVTSHTTKALNVLKDKVAPGLQNLCVAVLEDSNEDMERSVDGITSYMARTNSFEIQHEMERLEKERQQVIPKRYAKRCKKKQAIYQHKNY
ncbi:AAA domain-containing protein [Gemmiger sp.]